MDSRTKKNFQRYKRKLNSFAGNVSKMPVADINRELVRVERMHIPSFEKQMVRGTIFKKLSPSKRSQMGSSFGNVTPGSNAALTSQATQAAQTAMATQAAMTQAAATQAAMTQAASSAPGAIPSQPGFIPANQIPGQGAVSQSPQQVRITSGGAVAATDYSTAAGAINSAKDALLNAGQQLQQMAAAQNISGFGRYYY